MIEELKKTEKIEKREKIEGDRVGKRRNIINTEGPEIEMMTKIILLRMTSDQMSIMQDKARTITCENRLFMTFREGCLFHL